MALTTERKEELRHRLECYADEAANERDSWGCSSNDYVKGWIGGSFNVEEAVYLQQDCDWFVRCEEIEEAE